MSSSAGYASRLSKYDHKGVCGLPERYDSPRSLSLKLDKLAYWIQAAQGRVVILTGAGISTSAGIPDFRGPHGIWTLEKVQQQKQQQQNQRSKKTKKEKKKKKKEEKSNSTTNKKKKSRKNNVKEEGVEYEDEVNDEEDEDEEEDDDDQQEDEFNGGNNSRRNSRQRTITTKAASSSPPRQQQLLDWSQAKPTFTHYAITKLIQDYSIFRYCITQNVDGLHRRSGLSRNHHAVLHGCAFTEKCQVCQTEYFHDKDLGGMSFAKTGRLCIKCHPNHNNNNNNDCFNSFPDDGESDDDDNNVNDHHPHKTQRIGYLRDTLLDWNDPLPEADLERATEECKRADLVITLGTSLRMEPSGSLPTLANRFVIVNLQETPKDSKAALILRAHVDHVMKELLKRLEFHHTAETWIQQQPSSSSVVERIWTPPSPTTQSGKNAADAAVFVPPSSSSKRKRSKR